MSRSADQPDGLGGAWPTPNGHFAPIRRDGMRYIGHGLLDEDGGFTWSLPPR
jgi:hypothetical protein